MADQLYGPRTLAEIFAAEEETPETAEKLAQLRAELALLTPGKRTPPRHELPNALDAEKVVEDPEIQAAQRIIDEAWQLRCARTAVLRERKELIESMMRENGYDLQSAQLAAMCEIILLLRNRPDGQVTP